MPNEEHIVEAEEVAGPAKEPRGAVQIELESGLKRCQRFLSDNVEGGALELERRRRDFKRAWQEVIKNAAAAHGRDAVRAALIAMGRPEDTAKMF